MITTGTIAETRRHIAGWRRSGKIIGLVPTMGALHQGHLLLIQQCRDDCDVCAVSIFVNPTQFAPDEDLAEYPQTFDADLAACRGIGVNLIFAPSADEMCSDSQLLTNVRVSKLTDHLCGKSRPNHFAGVCTVVAKLFNIIQPDIAYFGQKDAQQLAVIKRMAADLNFPVEIRCCSIVRELDGLAMSSRNRYLDPAKREQAKCLSQSLAHAKKLISAGQTDSVAIITEIKNIIEKAPDAKIDYISVVDNDLLQPIDKINCRALIAIAVQIGPARLIDNIVVDPKEKKRQDIPSE